MDADTTANVTPTPTVPSSWPGAFGLFKHSKTAVMHNVWVIVGLNVAAVVVSGILSSLGAKDGHTRSWGELVANLVSLVFSVALTLVILAGVRGQKMDFMTALKKSLPFYVRALVLSILTVIICVVSFLLLVVPFFFVVPRISLAMYYLLDKNIGPVEALKASWHDTKGSAGKVWGIIGVNIVFAILALVIVGIYLLIMYMAASAILYMFLQANKAQTEQPAEVATPVEPIAS